VAIFQRHLGHVSRSCSLSRCESIDCCLDKNQRSAQPHAIRRLSAVSRPKQVLPRLDFASWHVLHLTNSDHSQDETSEPPARHLLHEEPQRMALGRDFLSEEGVSGKDHASNR
jgi:hypothetical protein